MKRVSIFIAVCFLPAALIIFLTQSKMFTFLSSGSRGGYTEINWPLLSELNLTSGEASEDLRQFDRQKVRIPGFVVPLTDDATEYKEFLLVPNPQACIHVPPPPPNQMVYVRMNISESPKREMGPVWIHGQLRIKEMESTFGKVAYELAGDSFEVYEF